MSIEPSTPPTNWTPAAWSSQFNKHQLCWLAETLRNRNEAARMSSREWQNRAILAESRLNVLEASIQQKERIR